MVKPKRWTASDWETANTVLWVRDRDRCGWCGQALRDRVDRHHRKRKTIGGDRFCNVVLLHPECHTVNAGSVHTEPALAMRRGFIVPSWADPLEVPILLAGEWFTFDDDGGRHRSPPPGVVTTP